MWILSFSSFPFPILLLVSISSPLHPPLLPPPLLLPYPFPLSLSLLYPHTLIYLVVSVLNIQAHYTSVDIWYRERKTDSHMCGPCIWGHIKWTVATPLWDWQALNPWSWFGAFCTVPSAFSKRERKMWQEPVPVTRSMYDQATFCCRAHCGRLGAGRWNSISESHWIWKAPLSQRIEQLGSGPGCVCSDLASCMQWCQQPSILTLQQSLPTPSQIPSHLFQSRLSAASLMLQGQNVFWVTLFPLAKSHRRLITSRTVPGDFFSPHCIPLYPTAPRGAGKISKAWEVNGKPGWAFQNTRQLARPAVLRPISDAEAQARVSPGAEKSNTALSSYSPPAGEKVLR